MNKSALYSTLLHSIHHRTENLNLPTSSPKAPNFLLTLEVTLSWGDACSNSLWTDREAEQYYNGTKPGSISDKLPSLWPVQTITLTPEGINAAHVDLENDD